MKLYYLFILFLKNLLSQKNGHILRCCLLHCFYLYIAILTFMFFPVEAIDQLIWASLNMWKIIEMPFVERFEYIGIATWFVIMLPNVCLYLWISGQMLKEVLLCTIKNFNSNNCKPLFNRPSFYGKPYTNS